MNRASAAGEIFKILVRDILCPIIGLIIGVRLGLGKVESNAVMPLVGFASVLLGYPLWSRADERKRGVDGKPRRRKSVTLDGSGIRWGEKAEAEAEAEAETRAEDESGG